MLDNKLENFDVFNDNEQKEDITENAESDDKEVAEPKEEAEVVEPKEQKQEGEEQEEDLKPDQVIEQKEESVESWTKKAVIDERRKRQIFESENNELKRKLEEFTNTEVKRPDVLDDPEGALKHTEQSFDEKLFQTKVAMSKGFIQTMPDKYPDYAEMETKFIDLAKDNPYLSQQIRQSDNPALFAYDTAKTHIENQSFSDPKYKENLKEQIRKEILAELAGTQLKKSQSSKASLPSFNKATSARVDDVEVEDDLFADSPF